MRRYGIPRRQQALYDRKRRHVAVAKMRRHFLARMAKRAPDIDAARLFDELAIAISHRLDGLVWKICRCPNRRECWRFRVGGRILYVIFSQKYLCPVTVMLPGQKVKRFRRKRLKMLRDAA